MMRSLYSGVSGLQDHQIRMDVLGNNIANVNTTGFKKERVTFQDLLYQQMSGAAAPDGDLGGVNPKEIGLGVLVGSIDTIHTQGALQTTGVGTDLAIEGNGFFVLKNGEQTLFTRDGALSPDRDGRLVNGSGYRVQGWLSQDINGQQVLSPSGATQDIVIPIGSKDPAKATDRVDMACNLDKRTSEVPPNATPDTVEQGTWRVEEKVYDSFGAPHTLRVEYRKVVGQPNQWQGTVAIDPEAQVPTNTGVALGANPAAANGNTFTVEFDNRGLLARVRDGQGNASAQAGALDLGVSFDVAGTTPAAGGGNTRQTFRINLGTVGSATNTVTQMAERSSTKVFQQNGYTMGYLNGFKVDQSGVITADYSNGTKRTIGQVALGSFTNPGGLEKVGGTNFAQSNNSGQANIGPSGIAGKGSIIAGSLEMSNVDLAEQMTDMIVTERGFQANSRTIQTSDQMLQELLTLKR